MKACIECKHFTTEGAINNQPRCARFGKYAERFHVVYGMQRHLAAPDCSLARSESGQCGPKGRSWESRYGVQEPPEAPPMPEMPDMSEPAPRRRWWQWLLPA